MLLCARSQIGFAKPAWECQGPLIVPAFLDKVWTINGRYLTQRMTGVQRYAYEIVAALDEILSQEADFSSSAPRLRLVLPSGARKPDLSKVDVKQTSVGSGHFWDQFVLPLYAGTGVLSLGNIGPLLKKRQIVCIHDTNVFIQPESYSAGFGFAYRTLLPLVGSRAMRVATVSQFSKDMLVRYGICRKEKIFVAPNGHEHALKWDASRAQATIIKELQRPYVLLLGSRARHKNIEVVLRQADGLDAAGIDLVVVGGASSIFSETKSEFQRPNIHYAGYVSDDDLAALYEGALCLTFPSTTEGFGIPPLEAMARGCPVISSNAPSLVEVGGDAIVHVNPNDGDGWRDAIIGLSCSENLRATMSAKGRKRAARFSWKRSAETYLEEISVLLKNDRET
jgi:glycosyltransferase involved in cell wall biosynthesis